VRTFRIGLLLLLAVLLPLRGALAAALPCPNGAHGAAVVVAPHDHHRHGTAAVAGGHLHADAGAGIHAASAHGHHHDGTGQCHACASCCTAPPMMATFSPRVAPVELPSVSFPTLTASAPSFVSEGQERPPRST
jgi:hypothetical protein